MYATVKVPDKRQRALSLAMDQEVQGLEDLEIDGYKVVFTTRVALMPVALADTTPASHEKRSRDG